MENLDKNKNEKKRMLIYVIAFVVLGGLVWAGTHNAEQVLGGVFPGNYIFTNNVAFNDTVDLKNASVLGLYGVDLSYNFTNLPLCNNSIQGKLVFLDDTKEVRICNSVDWKILIEGD